MAITQAKRSIQITTPLGKDALLITDMEGVERISQPFEWTLDMVSEKGDLDADALLGKNVTVKFELPVAGKFRFFNGFVTEFSQTGYRRRLHEYRAIVRPWFWFLSRTSDCRIFQQKTIPQIFEEVVKQYGFTDYKLKLHGSYQPWDYCVQYRETDLNFLSRLLEQEGISYYFEHQDGRHTIILSDDVNGHGQIADYTSVPFYPPDMADAARKRDHLSEWSFVKSVQPGAFATSDYDFIVPKNSLLAVENISSKHPNGNYEMFDYPAGVGTPSSTESKRFAKIRIQELQAPHTVCHGKGDAVGLTMGNRFKLTDYPRADLNIEYLIVATRFQMSSGNHDVGDKPGEVSFSIEVEAIDSKVPYRPPSMTPKPLIHGSQTALVVGASGEEIFTDKYGRVKVQFYWDRQGKQDENSSCWIRVAQVWAGQQWGAIHIPRVGQEVIVGFLEGDPDRPIITGRVYNGVNMPPWALPANKTQSGIITRSSKDGSPANFNQIRFEDKKGEEDLVIHAEKDQHIVVEHDENTQVGNDRTENVTANESITIGKDRTESVAGNETISISKDRSETVTGNESITIGKDQSVSIGQGRTLTISKDDSVSVGGSYTEQVGKDADITIAKKRSTSVGDNDNLTVGKQLVIDAGDAVIIKTGSASITMKKDGTITIKGKDITIDAGGKVNVKASSDVVLKGSKVTQN